MVFASTLALGASLVLGNTQQLKVSLHRTKILLLGCYHFANPGLDVVKAPLDDHLSAKRQEQIAELVKKLATFKPTHVTVEEKFGNPDTAKRFQSWVKGDRKLTVNESEQIGFRVAQAAGLAEIVPIDTKVDMDFDTFMKQASPEIMVKFRLAIGEAQKMMEGLSKHTVAENLKLFNSREADRMSNGLYLSLLAAVGKEAYPGVDLIAPWWKRNMYWIANLTTIAKSPDDRVLMVCGAGHASLIRSLLRDSLEFEVVDTLAYLP